MTMTTVTDYCSASDGDSFFPLQNNIGANFFSISRKRNSGLVEPNFHDTGEYRFLEPNCGLCESEYR